jgi:hypothetical protein
MTQIIDVTLEVRPSGTQPFHPAGSNYKYRTAEEFIDEPSRLTERQSVFYRNLITIAEKLQSQEIPIDFIDAAGAHMAMDAGCVKIAEHAAFLQPLANGPDGRVHTVRLSWNVTIPD